MPEVKRIWYDQGSMGTLGFGSLSEVLEAGMVFSYLDNFFT